MYTGLPVQYPAFLPDFKETLILSTDLRKNIQIPNSKKIRTAGSELFHVDGWTDRPTDMTKITDAFQNFANAPKKNWVRRRCRFFRPLSQFSPVWAGREAQEFVKNYKCPTQLKTFLRLVYRAS